MEGISRRIYSPSPRQPCPCGSAHTLCVHDLASCPSRARSHGTHGEPRTTTVRLSLTVRQNASLLTNGYRPLLCKAGVRHGAPCHTRATRRGQQRSTGVTPDHDPAQVKAWTRAPLQGSQAPDPESRCSTSGSSAGQSLRTTNPRDLQQLLHQRLRTTTNVLEPGSEDARTGSRSPVACDWSTPLRLGPQRWTGSSNSPRPGSSATRRPSSCGKIPGPNSLLSWRSTRKSARLHHQRAEPSFHGGRT